LYRLEGEWVSGKGKWKVEEKEKDNWEIRKQGKQMKKEKNYN
jgi:hypothetical protein